MSAVSLVLNNSLKSSVNELTVTRREQFGFLIGSSTSNQIECVKLIPSLVPTAIQDQGSPTQTDIVDEPWLLQNAEQINRCLIGGMQVVGVYICGTRVALQKHQEMLFKLLRKIHGSIQMELMSIQKVYKVILWMDSSNDKKLAALSIDVAQPRAAYNNANVSFKDITNLWQVMESDVVLRFSNECIPLETKCDLNGKVIRVNDKLDALMKSLVTSVETNLFGELLVSAKHSDGSLTFGEPGMTWRKCFGSPPSLSNDAIETNVFIMHSNSDPDLIDEPKWINDCAMVECKGTLKCQTVVSGSMPAEDKTNWSIFDSIGTNLKEDIVRSFSSRCQLHCDGLQVTEGDEQLADPDALHQLPRRVIIESAINNNLPLCDYLFEGDSTGDSVDSVSQLFATATITCDDVTDGFEKAPTTQILQSLGFIKLPTRSDSTSEGSESPGLGSRSQSVLLHDNKNRNSKKIIVFSIVIVILAVVIGCVVTIS